MKTLREKIFHAIRKHQPKRQIVMYPWDQIRSILILTNGEDVEKITRQLIHEKKNVDVVHVPQKQDVCWLTGRPKSIVLESLQARHYDLLIDLTQQPNITQWYMALYSKAGFKTGRHTIDNIYDLTIETPPQESPTFLFEQIVKYIQMLTKK